MVRFLDHSTPSTALLLPARELKFGLAWEPLIFTKLYFEVSKNDALETSP